jgi:hydrogenase expression/formation protein HypE
MDERISMQHGAGGRMMHDLIESVFRKVFNNEILNRLDDSAALGAAPRGSEVLFSTDSYVIKPLFFPGGDIGKLAVCGTMNDLAVSGAEPAFLSSGFIVEEGFEIDILEKIAGSMARECLSAGSRIVTGDFKVVEKGQADGLYINTSGIGFKNAVLNLTREKIIPGDKVLINGGIGEHEAAVLLERGDFKLKGSIKSDCCSLYPLISEICGFHMRVMESGGGEVLRFMRDPTRGGAAAVLNEIVSGADFGISVFEDGLPVTDDVDSVCEMLGLDAPYLANEGKVIAVVNGEFSSQILSIMKNNPLGSGAALAGEVLKQPAGKVVMRTAFGGERILGTPEGGQLPRIC